MSYTLNDHVRRSNQSDSDDSKSNASSVSSARQDDLCPCCGKEMQNRFMFNHLRKFHPEFVKGMYGVWKDEQMNELIAENLPFPIEWVTKDDFDDDNTKTMWGCLGCNNTYTTEYNAKKHCNGKCKKDHNANLRRIKKEEQQDKEKRDKKMSDTRYRWLNRTAKQVHACILQDVEFYDKRYQDAGTKIARYLHTLQQANARDYIYFPLPCPEFEDDKKKMELLEEQLDKGYTKWRRMYEDILPVLWGQTGLVSHTAYEEIEKLIMHTNQADYKF
jgi:hypothetical protein